MLAFQLLSIFLFSCNSILSLTFRFLTFHFDLRFPLDPLLRFYPQKGKPVFSLISFFTLHYSLLSHLYPSAPTSFFPFTNHNSLGAVYISYRSACFTLHVSFFISTHSPCLPFCLLLFTTPTTLPPIFFLLPLFQTISFRMISRRGNPSRVRTVGAPLVSVPPAGLFPTPSSGSLRTSLIPIIFNSR